MSQSAAAPQKPAENALRLLTARQARAQGGSAQSPAAVAAGTAAPLPGLAADVPAVPVSSGRRHRWGRYLALFLLLLAVVGIWRFGTATRSALAAREFLTTVRVSRLFGLGGRLPSGADVAGSIRSRELAGTEAELGQRARELARRESDLRRSQLALREIEAGLQAREAELNSAVSRVQAAAESQSGGPDGARLMRMYGEMRPRDAARIISGLNDDEALWILRQLDPAVAARVLAALESRQAARLTQRLIPPG